MNSLSLRRLQRGGQNDPASGRLPQRPHGDSPARLCHAEGFSPVGPDLPSRRSSAYGTGRQLLRHQRAVLLRAAAVLTLGPRLQVRRQPQLGRYRALPRLRRPTAGKDLVCDQWGNRQLYRGLPPSGLVSRRQHGHKSRRPSRLGRHRARGRRRSPREWNGKALIESFLAAIHNSIQTVCHLILGCQFGDQFGSENQSA